MIFNSGIFLFTFRKLVTIIKFTFSYWALLQLCKSVDLDYLALP